MRQKRRGHLHCNQPIYWPYAVTPRPFLVRVRNGRTAHLVACTLNQFVPCPHAMPPLRFISFPTFFASILFENFPRLVHGHAIGRHRIGWRRSGGHRRTGRHWDPVAPQQEGHDAAVVNPERKQLSACESRGGGGRNPRAAWGHSYCPVNLDALVNCERT